MQDKIDLRLLRDYNPEIKKEIARRDAEASAPVLEEIFHQNVKMNNPLSSWSVGNVASVNTMCWEVELGRVQDRLELLDCMYQDSSEGLDAKEFLKNAFDFYLECRDYHNTDEGKQKREGKILEDRKKAYRRALRYIRHRIGKVKSIYSMLLDEKPLIAGDVGWQLAVRPLLYAICQAGWHDYCMLELISDEEWFEAIELAVAMVKPTYIQCESVKPLPNHLIDGVLPLILVFVTLIHTLHLIDTNEMTHFMINQ